MPQVLIFAHLMSGTRRGRSKFAGPWSPCMSSHGHGGKQGSPHLLHCGAGVTSVGRGAPRWDRQSPWQEESWCRGRSVSPKCSISPCSTPKQGSSPCCMAGSGEHPWCDPVPAPTPPRPPRRQGLPGAERCRGCAAAPAPRSTPSRVLRSPPAPQRDRWWWAAPAAPARWL